MSILVTGASGYIGSALCPALEAKGYEVKRFDKVLGNDITNLAEVKESAKDVDLVIHLAAIAGYPNCDKDPELASQVNIMGTANVAGCGKPVIFTSILSTFNSKIVSEDTPPAPESHHAHTKVVAEQTVLAQPGNIVLRFGSLYGVSPSMRDDLLVHNLTKEAVKKGKITLFEADSMRQITSLGDAIEAIMFFISEEHSGIYNVVSINATKGYIAERVREITQCGIDTVAFKDKEKRDYFASTRKIQSLGFILNPNLKEAIREIVEYYKRLSTTESYSV